MLLPSILLIGFSVLSLGVGFPTYQNDEVVPESTRDHTYYGEGFRDDDDTPPANGICPNCPSGQTVTIQAGDDCQKIAVENGVATQTFIRINDLNPECTDLVPDTQLCLPKACDQPYIVVEGDTCEVVAENFGISVEDLRSVNKFLDAGCTNLILGFNICLPATAQADSSAEADAQEEIEDPAAEVPASSE